MYLNAERKPATGTDTYYTSNKQSSPRPRSRHRTTSERSCDRRSPKPGRLARGDSSHACDCRTALGEVWPPERQAE